MKAPFRHHYKGRLVYGITTDGIHHVAESTWYPYMTMRTETPHKVIIYDTVKALEEVLDAEGAVI